MGKLTVIRVHESGRTEYALDGCFGFASVDGSALKPRDSVRDNGGRGMTMYAVRCSGCAKIYLVGMSILVPWECERCERCERGSLR